MTVNPQRPPDSVNESSSRHTFEASGNIKHRAAASVLWLGGSRVAALLIDQVFTIVLVRLLAPGDFGLVAMAAVFTALLGVFADMGIAPAIVQRPEINDEYLSTAFWSNFLFGLLLCGVALGGSVLIARFFQQPLLQLMLAVLSLRFVFAGTAATMEALLTRAMAFRVLTSRHILSTVIGGTLSVIVAFAGAGVWSLVLRGLATSVALTVLLALATSWRPKRLFSWMSFKDIWGFGIRVLGYRFFGYAVRNFDNLAIGRFLGPTQLGYYAFGYAVFLLPISNITQVLGQVSFSAFSRVQRDAEKLHRGFVFATRYVSFLAFPASIGLFLTAPDLIIVVAGPSWAPAVPVLRVLLIAALLRSHTNIWSAVYRAMGRADWLLKWSFASACLYVPAFFVGLRWGIVGVAIGYTASTLVLVPVQMRLLQRLVPFRTRDYLSTLTPFAAASAVMGACVLLSQSWLSGGENATLRLGVAVVLGILSYGLAILMIRRELVVELVEIARQLRQSRGADLTRGAVEA